MDGRRVLGTWVGLALLAVPALALAEPSGACARPALRCAQCEEADATPFKVGESFVDQEHAVAAANERLQAEDAAGIARELRVGSVAVSVLEMSAHGMGGIAILRQDAGRVCVIGEWAWNFGGNEVAVEIATVAQVPARGGVLVVLKAIGRAPHTTDESSYYPDVRLLSAFLITAERVAPVLGELVDDEPNPSYGQWSQPVHVERVGSSLRLSCGRRSWILAPGASEFARAGRAKRSAPGSRGSSPGLPTPRRGR
jgi:hypothetical protein